MKEYVPVAVNAPVQSLLQTADGPEVTDVAPKPTCLGATVLAGWKIKYTGYRRQLKAEGHL